MFTCQHPGVYHFSFNCVSFAELTSVYLRRNKQVVTKSFVAKQGNMFTSTGDTVLELEAGDKLWLEVSKGADSLSASSFFSGYLLFTV